MIRPLIALLLSVTAGAQTNPQTAIASGLNPTEGDYVVRVFTVGSGEALAELRLHYTTLGKPQRDAGGHVANAVLIMHGTGGEGHAFRAERFAGGLCCKNEPLDASKYYILLPDAGGHGKTRKPREGLRIGLPL